MIKKSWFFLVLICLITFNSCKNDLNINGDYKLVTVVYGLLNHKDSVHYLKIYKSFLTEENVLVAANNLDNYSFYDSIEVYLIQTLSNGVQSKISFDTTTAIAKESGIFHYPKQILYFSNAVLNKDAEFELNIKNKYTGEIIASSTTSLVKSYYNSKHNPYNIIAFMDSVTKASVYNYANNNSISFPIRSTSNSKRYQAAFEFYYFETNTITNVTVHKGPIEIDLGKSSSTSETGGQEVSFVWTPSSFYSKLAAKIDVMPNVERYADTLRLKIWAAGKNYSDYIETSGSNYSIIEERPIISNINGGIGLFSSRFMFTYKYLLNTDSRDSLINGSLTRKLNFK